MIKNIKTISLFLVIAITLSVLTIPKQIFAKNYSLPDDPGAGRLTGDNIPDSFYDNQTSDKASLGDSDLGNIQNDLTNIYSLYKYGSSQSESPYTKKTYTHQDQFDGYTLINGIDVSFYQGNIDWAKVKAAGIDFAIIRAGYRGYSAGTLGNDTYFDKHMAGAAAAGVKTGIYIYSQAITEAEAIEEAQFILDKIGTYTVDMPLVLDFEFYSSSAGETGRLKNAKLSKADATKVCLAFCKTIYDAGYTPMVYANSNMLTNYLNADVISSSYPVWLANYTTATKYNGQFSYWQYASTGKVDGISGSVDMNFYYAPPEGDLKAAIIPHVSDQLYTAEPILPPVTVKMGDTVLMEDQDYTVTYSNNTDIGTASVTVTGIGHYTGTRTLTFNIVDNGPLPLVTGIDLKKRTTTYITLKWNKQSNIDGYQIYRSTAYDGTYKNIKTISSASTKTYKNTKLTVGQAYYYKLRTYKKTDEGTKYGDFSSVITLYTKTGYTRLALAKSSTPLYINANTESDILATPAKNTSMKVTYSTKDSDGNTWYHVTYGNITGYVKSGTVTIAKQGTIRNASKVNVRKSAKISSKKLTTLKKNTKVTVLKTKKVKGLTWYNVTFKKSGKTYKGWIAYPYVKI